MRTSGYRNWDECLSLPRLGLSDLYFFLVNILDSIDCCMNFKNLIDWAKFILNVSSFIWFICNFLLIKIDHVNDVICFILKQPRKFWSFKKRLSRVKKRYKTLFFRVNNSNNNIYKTLHPYEIKISQTENIPETV